MESGKSETSRLDLGHIDGWLYQAVDLLASEYGWTKDYILHHIYPDDYMLLGELISKRIIDKVLMDYQIAHNPHRDPKDTKEFGETLLEQRRLIYGISDNDAQFDRNAFEELRSMTQNRGSMFGSK